MTNAPITTGTARPDVPSKQPLCARAMPTSRELRGGHRRVVHAGDRETHDDRGGGAQRSPALRVVVAQPEEEP